MDEYTPEQKKALALLGQAASLCYAVGLTMKEVSDYALTSPIENGTNN